MPTVPAFSDSPDAPAQDCAAVLAEALAQSASLHLPGERIRHRRLLELSISLAQRVLAPSENEGDSRVVAAARSALVKAHAARALDARHGAGQLSLGSQRAPTRDDCDDGWQRVEEVVAVAEASAIEATRLAGVIVRSQGRPDRGTCCEGCTPPPRRTKPRLYFPRRPWFLIWRRMVPGRSIHLGGRRDSN